MAEIDWIDDPEGFSSLRDEWEDLAGPDSLPFDLHRWFEAWWGAFGSSGEMAICTLRRGGRLDGVFPLRRSGRSLRAMANVHSPSFRPLARDPEALAELSAAAMGAGGELEICCLPARPAIVEEIRAGAGSASMMTLIEPSYSSPTVDTCGDFEAWRTASKQRWGAPLERFRRKMARDHELRSEIVRAPVDLDDELADGFRVEASGWKRERGTAIVSSADTEAFYTSVGRLFAEVDALRLSRLVLDGETVSFDFGILHDRRLYLLKTGFDERFRKLAPGLVMRLSIIERCFELGLRSYELLGDESEWKSKFATGTRPHCTLRAYRRRPAGIARYGYRAILRPRLRTVYRGLQQAGADGR